jgi:hypothetical protein
MEQKVLNMRKKAGIFTIFAPNSEFYKNFRTPYFKIWKKSL